MKSTILATLAPALVGVLLVPLVALAQDAPRSEGQLQIEQKQRRIVVRPRPSTETAASDIAQVTDEIAREQRQAQMTRETVSPVQRRPDLNQDVIGGIQTQNVLRALRR